MTMSRMLPLAPFEGELAKATVAIVTAGGVHLKEQEGLISQTSLET